MDRVDKTLRDMTPAKLKDLAPKILIALKESEELFI
jgi:hypothetical protein